MATNTYGRWAASRPANTSEAELYLVPAATYIVGTLRVCNQDTVTRTCNIAHTDATGAAAGEDWIAYTLSMPAGSTAEFSVSLGPAESIRIQASVADKLSFQLTGLKIA